MTGANLRIRCFLFDMRPAFGEMVLAEGRRNHD